MNPRVSVIVATRDYGRFLAETLQSVFDQTFADWELIVVDDGSRDHTPEVVASVSGDPRVRIIRTDGLGQSRAKNLGIGLARAPLLAFLDGDDVWLPTKLEKQVRRFDADPATGVVYSRRHLIDEAGLSLPAREIPFHRGRIFNEILLTNFVTFSSVVVRREVFTEVGTFDERLDLAIDYDLWLRVAPHWEFDYVDEPLVKYRTGHGNLSKRIGERLTSVLSIMRRCLGRRGMTPPAAIEREAWGSTCRTMGYVERASGSLSALYWYIRAAWHDGRWPVTLHSLLAVIVKRLPYRDK